MIAASPAFLTANAALAKQPIYLFEITGYSRAFTNQETGVSGQDAWMETSGMADLTLTVSDIDGGADLSELSITVQDHNGLITADMPTALFEGKVVTFKTGFPGMSQSDFVTLFTGVIDTVDSANGNLSYTFNCFDISQLLTKVIYTVGDDLLPTDSSNPKSLLAHPLDILIEILTTELGLTLAQLNVAKIYGYRDSTFAGNQFEFSVTNPPAAKDFIEQQLLQPLGGYLWVNSKGQFDVNFFYPNYVVPVFSGGLLGAWVDGTGQLVSAPFLIGNGITIKVPSGATALQLGMNDHFYTDNIGSWSVTVNGGSPITVSGGARPYTVSGGLNSAYPFSSTGSSSPASTSVTAGTTITIAVSGAAGLNSGFGTSDGTGTPADTSTGSIRPGDYAAPKVVPKLAVMSLTVGNTLEIPLAGTADLINTISFSLDKDSQGTYETVITEEDGVSIARFGSVGAGQLYGQQIIQSDGIRSAFQGASIAALTSRAIFQRYGLKNQMYEGVPLLWTACVLEPGDIVALTNAFVPDRQAGVMGVTNRLMEVMDRDWNFEEGTVTVKLLDAAYLSASINTVTGLPYLIAPTGEAAYTSASTDDKGTYQFLCNDSDQYSDSSAAHPLG